MHHHGVLGIGNGILRFCDSKPSMEVSIIWFVTVAFTNIMTFLTPRSREGKLVQKRCGCPAAARTMYRAFEPRLVEMVRSCYGSEAALQLSTVSFR